MLSRMALAQIMRVHHTIPAMLEGQEDENIFFQTTILVEGLGMCSKPTGIYIYIYFFTIF